MKLRIIIIKKFVKNTRDTYRKDYVICLKVENRNGDF